MRIIKKGNLSPSSTAPLWYVPSIFYCVGKMAGTEYNHNEFIWWIYISLAFIIWAFLNYKISNDEN